MRTRHARTLLWIAPLALASVALAQQHAAPDAHDAATVAAEGANPMKWDIVPYISALIVFGAAFFILSRTAWPRIVKGLEEREKKILSEIETAERTRRQAESALAEYQKSLAEARVEAGKILEQARADHQKVAAELRARTEAELNNLRDAARRDIETAKQQAVGEIYEHMSGVATAIAGRILRKEISAADHDALVEESLNQFATSAAT